MNQLYSFGYILLSFSLICFNLQGESGPRVHHLGPTGFLGTLRDQSILVTEVEKGSPSEGLIKKGDVIIGMGKTTFKGDVRKELAKAIDEAEAKKNGGVLSLLLKGDKTVDVNMRFMGAYRESAPYDCPKTEAIIEQTAEALIKTKKFTEGATCSGMLGLMATGEKKYIDLVGDALKEADWAHTDGNVIEDILTGEKDYGLVTWSWGYRVITLAEYYHLTGDRSILPAIRTYAITLAKGQDAGGMWGHRLISEKRNWRLPGYAQMNQPSLTCFMALIFAKNCGVEDPDLNKGLDITRRYYETYIGKGSFNYGVHGPNTSRFNNNGTSGSAAVCFSLLNNKEGTAFFSQSSATAYNDMESGHASSFFNPLWTPLGASLSGPQVTQKFFERSRWLQTMYRSWDGSFSRYGQGGKEGPQAGVALLTYCLPRRALFITGKKSDASLWLQEKDAEAVVEMDRLDYQKQSNLELLSLLGHSMPQITRRALWTLRERDPDFLETLTRMAKKGSKIERLSAIGYFGYQCPEEQALPQLKGLGEILRDRQEDAEIRAEASSSLSYLGEAALPYYQDMLRLVVEEEPGDAFRDVDAKVAKSLNTLSGNPYQDGLVIDKTLFYSAALKLIEHKRQDTRTEGLKMIANVPEEDFPLVAEKILHVIEDKDHSYHSYHTWQGSIGAAIQILANLNIREGLDYTMGILDREGGKWGFKVRMVAAALPKYGANARKELNVLKTKYPDMLKGKFKGPWLKMIQTIEEDKNPRQLVSLSEVLKKDP